MSSPARGTKDKRNRLVSGSGTGGVDEVAAAKEGPVFVTGGRKHSHPLITQLKWTGNVPLRYIPCRHAQCTTAATAAIRHRHRYYNYNYYYSTITIVATILHYRRNCTTVSEWCNSQPIWRAQTTILHRYLVYAALIDIRYSELVLI